MITSDQRDGLGVVTIDRHDRRNALDLAHCRSLHETVTALATEARVILLTGSGSTFCAGADLDAGHGAEFRQALYGMLHTVAAVPIPVVAAVNGPAVGAGTQLALAADLRVAVPEAFFSVPTAGNGLAVDPWTVRRLALLAGAGAARAMLLGCDRVDAALAHQRGLVDRVGDMAAAERWAREIAGLAPLSLRYSKRALDSRASDEQLEREFEACWASDDVAEGSRARAERRKPRFQGR